MPIIVTPDDQKFAFDCEGSTIYFRRILKAEWATIRAACTVEGKNGEGPGTFDDIKFDFEILSRAVTGWDNIDEVLPGKDAPEPMAFSPAGISKLFESSAVLRGDMLNRVLNPGRYIGKDVRLISGLAPVVLSEAEKNG